MADTRTTPTTTAIDGAVVAQTTGCRKRLRDEADDEDGMERACAHGKRGPHAFCTGCGSATCSGGAPKLYNEKLYKAWRMALDAENYDLFNMLSDVPGFDWNAPDAKGIVAIFEASTVADSRYFDRFLRNPAVDLTVCRATGMSLVEYCLSQQRTKCSLLFITPGLDLTVKFSDGDYAIHKAARMSASDDALAWIIMNKPHQDRNTRTTAGQHAIQLVGSYSRAVAFLMCPGVCVPPATDPGWPQQPGSDGRLQKFCREFLERAGRTE